MFRQAVKRTMAGAARGARSAGQFARTEGRNQMSSFVSDMTEEAAQDVGNDMMGSQGNYKTGPQSLGGAAYTLGKKGFNMAKSGMMSSDTIQSVMRDNRGVAGGIGGATSMLSQPKWMSGS